MLKKRLITAIILIPVVLAILFFLPVWLFCFLTALLALAGAWEWSNLMRIETYFSRLLYVLLMALMFFGALFVPVPLILMVAFIWWCIAFLLILFYPDRAAWWNNRFTKGVMGLFVIVPCWTSINFIRGQNDGDYALLFLLVIIWSADSAAYFVGKKWGKTKLAPHVSPGKSIQGLAGAIIFSLAVALMAFWLCGVPVQIWPWGFGLIFLTVVFSVIGDLFESMMKRQVNLKDSGNLLPGHGGLLDRIDSLTAAAPVFALGAWLIGVYLG